MKNRDNWTFSNEERKKKHKIELLHADAIKDLLKRKRDYTSTQCRYLLKLARAVVEADFYDGRDEAISQLEEFLR